MNETIFSGTAMVELQGEEALQLLKMDIQHAEYRVLGFDQMRIFITDHRAEGVNAVYDAVNKGKIHEFAQRFSTSAFVQAVLNDNSMIMIDLYETRETNTSNILWIAVGMPNSIPIYDYHYYYLEPIGQDVYAFLSVFSVEYDPQPLSRLTPTLSC